MKAANIFTLTTSPPALTGRNSPGIALRRYGCRFLNRNIRRRPAVKELDSETGLYYYGARYLDPKTSRWISGDPALGEYLPSAPVDEEARKRNQSLPGQGGVFNYVNLHAYHYAGNNPVKYVDPDGKYLINNVARNTRNARNFASATSPIGTPINSLSIGFTQVFQPGTSIMITVRPKDFVNQIMPFNTGIELDPKLTVALDIALNNRDISNITASAKKMENGNFEITVTVRIGRQPVAASTVAFADRAEVLNEQGGIDRDKVKNIANDTINIVRNTVKSTDNIDRVN